MASRSIFHHTFFVLLYLISAVISEPASSTSQCAVSTCTDPTRFVYETGQTYIYDYEARITTTLDGSTDQSSGYFLQSSVHFQILSTCELAMTMHNTKLLEVYDAADDQYDQTPHQKFQAALEEHPLRFAFHDGLIETVCSSVSQPDWVLNVKKGVLSLFQNSMKTDERRRQKIQEVDILGTCDTEYIVTQGWRATIVKKSKMLDSCSDHQLTLSAIQANPFLAGASQSLPLVHGTQECEQTISHALLERVECLEEHHLRPFSGPEGGGAVTRVQQSLTFSADIDGTTVPISDLLVSMPLLFQHTFSDGGSHDHLQANSAHKALQQLCDNVRDDVQEDTPVSFQALVEQLQLLEARHIQRLVDDIAIICKRQKEKGRKFLLDALAQMSTPATQQVMTHLVGQSLVPEATADWWFFNLGLQPQPTEASIQAVAPLLELPQLSESAFLGISSLVATYCRSQPLCESSAQVLRIIHKLESNLGSACEVTSEQQLPTVILSLKALGNIGLPQRSHAVLSKCVRSRSLPTEIRLAAIQAHRRISCDMLRSSLLETFLETTEDSELRIALYVEIMRCPTKEVIESIHSALNTETVNQVGSFIWTHLTNLQESADLCKADIQGLLADYHLQKKFSTDARKFSRAYEWSFFSEALDAGTHVDGSLIFSPDSYLPRSAMLNLTVDLFGRSVNLFELTGRMQGFEESVESLFGPSGAFPAQPVKSGLRALRDKWNIDQQKLKQLSDLAESQRRQDRQPHATAAIKIFGNELMSWSVHGMQQLSHMHNTWNLQSLLTRLATDHHVEVTHSALLLKGQAALATGTGLPLRLAINCTAVVSLSAAGHMDLRRLASRSVEIMGHLSPSGSVHIMGSMAVDGIISQAGVELKTSLHSSTFLDGRIEIRAKELVRIRVNMPKEKVEIIDLKSQLFVTQGQWRQAIAGVQRDRLDVSHCTGDLTSRALGVEMCGHISYPNASAVTGAPYFPLTGPAQLQLYLRKMDQGLSSFLLEYRWEKDQVITAEGKQYQRNFLVSLKTPHSVQDRELTAELIINEADRSLSCRLLSPFKKIVINGQYVFEAEHKKLEATLSIDGQQYLVTTDLKTDTTETTSRLTPRIHVRLPDGPVLSLTGFIYLQLGKKLIVDLRLDHLTTRPIVLVGEMVRSEREGYRRLDWDATFGSPTLESRLQGYLQVGGGAWSATSGVEYWRPTDRGGPPTQKHRIDLLAKFRNMSPPSRALTRLTATAELQMTAYPQYSVAIGWTFLNAVGHIENTFEVGLGPNARHRDHQLTLQQVLSYAGHGTHQDNNITARFSVSYPVRGVHCVLRLHHRSTKHATTTEAELQLDPQRSIALEATYHDESHSLAKIHGTLQLHLPTRTIKLQVSLEEKNRNEYILEAEAQWEPGTPLKMKGLYRNRSTRLQLSYDLEANAQTPAGMNYSIQGHFLAAENRMSIGSQILAQEGQYSVQANLTRQHRGSYYLQTSADWPGDFYKGVANLTLGDEKVLTIDAHLGRVRRIRGEAAIQHFDDLQSCVMELLWDADRDPSLKMTLNARHRQPSLGDHRGEVYFTHPHRNFTFTILSRTYGSWNEGPLSSASEIVLDWGRRLTLSTELQQTTGPKRRDISILASADTPFQGFEVLHASATHSSDDVEWATQAKIMGPAGKAVHLDTKTTQSPRSNHVETQINVATPFVGYKNVTIRGWHRDDEAEVALGIESQWDQGKQMIFQAYASDTEHLQEKEDDEETEGDDINMRGGISISSPWTGSAGAAFYHLVTAMMIDSKAEVHWGQQGSADNVSDQKQTFDLKRLSMALSARTGQRGPNVDTEASAHIITPLEGFERAGALLTHSTDYSGFQSSARVLWGHEGMSLDDALRIQVKGWHQATTTATNMHAELSIAAPFAGLDEVGAYVQHTQDWNKLSTSAYARWSQQGFFNASIVGRNTLDRVEGDFTIQTPWSGYQLVAGSLKHHLTPTTLNSSIGAYVGQGEQARRLRLAIGALWHIQDTQAHRVQGSVVLETPTVVLKHFSLSGSQIKARGTLVTIGNIDINGNKAWINHNLDYQSVWHLTSQLTASMPPPLFCSFNITHEHKKGYFYSTIHSQWEDNNEATARLELRHEGAHGNRLLRAAVDVDTPFEGFFRSIGTMLEYTHMNENRTLRVAVKKEYMETSVHGWLYIGNHLVAGNTGLTYNSKCLITFKGELILNPNQRQLTLDFHSPIHAVQPVRLDVSVQQNLKGNHVLYLSYEFADTDGQIRLTWLILAQNGLIQFSIESSIPGIEHLYINNEWQWSTDAPRGFKSLVQWNMWQSNIQLQLTDGKLGPHLQLHSEGKASPFKASANLTCTLDNCSFRIKTIWEETNHEEWTIMQQLDATIAPSGSRIVTKGRFQKMAYGNQRLLMGEVSIISTKALTRTIPWHTNILLGSQVPRQDISKETISDIDFHNWEGTSGDKTIATPIYEWQFSSHLAQTDKLWEANFNMKYKTQNNSLTVQLQHDPPRFIASLDAPFTPYQTTSLDVSLVPDEEGFYATALLTIGDNRHTATGYMVNMGNEDSYKLSGSLGIQSTSLSLNSVTAAVTVRGGIFKPLEAALTVSTPDQSVQVTTGFKSEGEHAGEVHLVINAPGLTTHTLSFDAAFHRNAWQAFDLSLNMQLSKQWYRCSMDFHRLSAWEAANITATVTTPIEHYQTFHIHSHYKYEPWQHLQAGADVISPFQGYEKFNLFASLQNKIYSGKNSKHIINFPQQVITKKDDKIWQPSSDWTLETNMETAIDGWDKVTLMISRQLALDGINYLNAGLHFQRVSWSAHGTIDLSALPNLLLDIQVVTPFTHFGNLSLELVQRLDKQSYTGKIDSRWLEEKNFGIQGQFAASAVVLNISTPFDILPSGHVSYEYHNTDDQLVAKSSISYHSKMLAALNLHLLNDIQQAKWRTSIDLHNPWQPVGIAVGMERNQQEARYSSQLCWNLDKRDVSTLTGEAAVRQTIAGREFVIETVHPERVMRLQSRYLCTSKRFAHDARFQWESTSTSALGYAIALNSKTPQAPGHPVQYNASFALTSPLREVEVGGEVTISMTEFEGKAILLWDAGRDRTREAGVRFQLQDVDSSQSAYNGYISFYHPRLEKDITLHGNISYATDRRDFLSLLLEADYSPRPQHRLTFSANIINDAIHYSTEGVVEATVKLLHPASGLNIQLVGNATDSPIRCAVAIQLIYQDKYDTPKLCTLLGVLAKMDRHAQVEVRLPRSHWQTQASIKQHHTSYLASLSHQYNDIEQMFAEARIDNQDPSANISIFNGQERNLMYSVTTGLETSRHFVFKAVRHQLTKQIHDSIMTLTLPHPFLVNYRLKWQPTLIEEILDTTNITARFLLEELKSSWTRFRRYLRDEALTKRRRFLATTNNAWEDMMDNVDDELKSIQRDLQQMQQNIEAMYDDNHFYFRQTVEWLQEHGLDLRDFYQQFTDFMDALNKALLHELGIMTATIMAAWDAGREMFSEGVDGLLEFVISQGSAFGHAVQNNFQQLKRQIARTLSRFVELVTRVCQTWMTSLSSLRRLLWEKLSALWTRLRAWGEGVVQQWHLLKQKLLDVVYQLRDGFLKHPLYVNMLAWIKSMYHSFSTFWHKELYAALERHLVVVWEALIEGQSSFIGFLIRQGKWLKDKVDQYVEWIRNNAHVVFYTNLVQEVRQKIIWVLNYYQLRDNWTLLPLRIYQAVSTLTQRTGYQRGIKYDTLNRVTFSYSEGRVEIDQYLPMAWYALTRWPQVDQLPEVRLYNILRTIMSGSGPSFWDTFYTYQPYLTSTSTWLPPFQGYAILAGKQHFVTFDKAFFVAAGECTYLLSHDYIENNFTIALKYESRGAQPSLIVTLGDREAEITAAGKVIVNGKKAELPQVVGEHYIVRQGNLLVASPARGVFLECNLAFHYCLLRVDGWYFARTTGLFGSYNNEPSDDTIPSSDSSSAMSTWEVGSGRCRSHHNRAVMAPRTAHVSPICSYYFEGRNSIYRHCFKQVDPRPYYQMCLNDITASYGAVEETICTSTAAYVTACHMARVLLRTPRSCIRCPVSDNHVIIGGDNVTLHEGQVQPTSDVVLIIEAKLCNQKVAAFLPELVKNVEDSLVQAGIMGNRYSVVGFGGKGVYDKPHTHTMDGDVFGSSKVVISAIANIEYGDGISDAFTALHFAANLPFRAGVSKTFIVVLCTECQQTSHWVGYQEVYRTLLEDGIHVHLLIDHEFSIRNTKDFYGLDGTHAFTVKDARTKTLRGDRDLRSRVLEPKYICIPPALESNGSVFSARRLMDGKRRTKSFLDVFGRRVAHTASPASCQRCDCVPDAFGAGKIHCQPCLYPGSTFLFGYPDIYGPDEDTGDSGEELISAETTASPSRQKTKGNRRNKKRKRSRGPKTPTPQSQEVTESSAVN